MSTYKTSTIKLYVASPSSNWQLLPHKLFIVDDIEGYLATQTAYTVSLFQYQKIELEMSITVDLSQTYAEPLNASYKYVRIENSDDTGHYYYFFVKNAVWRSKSAVRFDLVLDVLNTFKEGTHYNFKANTKITREHKDRFVIKNLSRMHFKMSNINESTEPSIDDYLLIYTYPDMTYLGKIKVTAWNLLQETMSGDVISDSGLTTMSANTNITAYIEIEGDDPVHSFTGTVNSYSFDRDIFRNIDYIEEGINPLLQCGTSTGSKIEKESPLNVDWYLLYRNVNTPDPDDLTNPVECFLIPSTNLSIYATGLTGGVLKPSSIENNKYYYINMRHSKVTLSNGTTLGRYLYYNDFLIVKKQANGKLSVTYCEGGVGGTDEVIDVWPYDDIDYITLDDLPQAYASTSSPYEVADYINTILGNETDSWTGSDVDKQIDSIDLLDRADAKNIKLIKLPYCPYDFTITSDKIDLNNSDWNYETITQSGGDFHALKLYDLNTKLHSEFTITQNPLTNLKMTSFTPAITDLRQGANYESKLYNSEFYRGTYVYDSFQFAIQLEKCNISDYYSSQNMTIYFDMTKTINSRFMFTFTSYNLRNAAESYAKYMPIARNNEEVLYNVPYINYVKSGFNYDIKAKNISNASNWIGAGLSAAGVVASLALPSAPLKALGIVSSLISLAMTTKNAITTTIQNEQSIERKLKEASMQTASVAGADDVDLMSVYAENRLKYLVYEPNAIMKEMLYNLFFYAGYASNRLAIPTHNNRINFDYLEADVVIEKCANIPDDCLKELINSFKYGVTYIHKTSRVTNKWDMEQVYENWEVSLI